MCNELEEFVADNPELQIIETTTYVLYPLPCKVCGKTEYEFMPKGTLIAKFKWNLDKIPCDAYNIIY